MVAGGPLAVGLVPAWQGRARACARTAAAGAAAATSDGVQRPDRTPRPSSLVPRTAVTWGHAPPPRPRLHAGGRSPSVAARPPRQPPAGERPPASAGSQIFSKAGYTKNHRSKQHQRPRPRQWR